MTWRFRRSGASCQNLEDYKNNHNRNHSPSHKVRRYSLIQSANLRTALRYGLASWDMEEQIKKILRRLDSIEKLQNLVYQDRDILEDISIRLGKVEDEIKLLRERVDKNTKVTSADLQEVATGVIEIKETLDEKGGE